MAYQIKVNKNQRFTVTCVDFKNIPFGKVFSDHMFEADYIDGAWTNPNIRPVEPLAIHPANQPFITDSLFLKGWRRLLIMKATRFFQAGNAC